MQIEHIFVNIQKEGKATWEHSRASTRELVRIILYHTDFWFLVGGMALLVFVTRSFTEPGVDYGPWRPVVVSLAALLAGGIPVVMMLVLYPIHILLRANTWVLTALNIVLSANLFALIEPAIPNYFYNEGVLAYNDLIFGILVFYALALGYLQLRLNQYYCFSCYQQRHQLQDLNSLLPPNKRGNITCLSAKDHYVEITTDNGQHMNRMSMKDAVAMLHKKSGIQVHRSHWVAYSAMLSLEAQAGRHILTLRNGQQVPVSKAKLAKVMSNLQDR